MDGSIEVFTPPPAERFWTNPAGGNYDVAANWLNNFPPRPQDNANFTNSATYQAAKAQLERAMGVSIPMQGGS